MVAHVTDVRLHVLDEPTLARLVAAAVADADPTEVIPPVPGSVGWDAAARERLRTMHRECRPGLRGPLRQETYAVLVDGKPAGAIRLCDIGAGVFETGMWLTRAARGRGAGSAALAALIERARAVGAVTLVADTAVDNIAAQRALQRLGFDLAPRPDGRLGARLCL
jgi:[ribosomal protein S5]-alanine N-acetyltransferase